MWSLPRGRAVNEMPGWAAVVTGSSPRGKLQSVLGENLCFGAFELVVGEHAAVSEVGEFADVVRRTA